MEVDELDGTDESTTVDELDTVVEVDVDVDELDGTDESTTVDELDTVVEVDVDVDELDGTDESTTVDELDTIVEVVVDVDELDGTDEFLAVRSKPSAQTYPRKVLRLASPDSARATGENAKTELNIPTIKNEFRHVRTPSLLSFLPKNMKEIRTSSFYFSRVSSTKSVRKNEKFSRQKLSTKP